MDALKEQIITGIAMLIHSEQRRHPEKSADYWEGFKAGCACVGNATIDAVRATQAAALTGPLSN